MDRNRLRSLARDALDDLHQEALLEQHPLAKLLVPQASPGVRGRGLRAALIGAIEQLRPPHTMAMVSPVWRRYRSLCQRYLEGKTFKQIAEVETISVRQAVRDHHEAIEMLSDAVWTAYCRVQEQEQAHDRGDPSPIVSASFQPEGSAALEGELLRFSSGGTVSDQEPTRLDEVLADALAVLQPLIIELGASVESSVPTTLPSVTSSRPMLRQALLSILSYAVERSPGGKVALVANAAGDRAELWITATGWTETLGKVAEESARLAISRRLVEVEGGRLEIRSSEGLNSGVRLDFPVSPEATVLVVDDNPDLARLFQRYLVGTNYRIVQATTGQHALELARELRPIAITLDLMMPSRDGWELLQDLLRGPATQGPPIVVCSVLPGRALALALGASHFLAKPVTREALLAVLASCQSSGPGEPPG